MKVVVVGNGILGLTSALRILRKEPDAQIMLIGPRDRKGCASLAAAAMFNSFCELDKSTLSNEVELDKFKFNKAATPLWPKFIEEIESLSDQKLAYGFGTFLVNNHLTDTLEDENFDAIVSGLDSFKEPYERVEPSSIPNYRPAPGGRASRALFIPGEGWINPVSLISALDAALSKSGRVEFVEHAVTSLKVQGGKVQSVVLDDRQTVHGDHFVMAAGANTSKIFDASELSLKMPRIFYGIGCSILLHTGAMTLKNCVRTPNRGLACGVYAAPQSSEHMLIGASNFISPVPEDGARLTSVHALMEAAMDQINESYYRAQVVRINVGWRPTSADTVPLIGSTSLTNLVIATGTKRDGLHCSPLISDYVSDLVLNRTPTWDLNLFKPERDLIRIYAREEAIENTVRHTINAAYQHGFVPAKNRMVDDLRDHYRNELTKLHDQVGAVSWGIPAELVNMYKYGHIK